MKLHRRDLLAGAATLTTAALAAPDRLHAAVTPARVAPVPAGRVRLKPSIFADAERANRAYLASLDPDRLLHNFHQAAGLAPLGARYGGWEAQSIAGHTLGHYLSACALVVAGTGDPLLRRRLTDTVAQMTRIQAAHGDGYCAGGTRWGRDDAAEGKQLFEELRRGDIRASRFSLNDGWVPVYSWHKIHAGLLDAHRLAAVPRALGVALGMADYLGTIVEGLSDAQVQQLLVTEHGGINEAFAETHALTGDPRWLAIARRLRHRAVLDPLAAGRDELAGLHANTQIPKVIGLARIHELAGTPADADAARFFHQTVTRRHSYVIGGNSNREHFSAPGKIAAHVAETTCEACNTYNMLKLTRHLYGWAPNAGLFDFYERAQLNHVMAHQRPDDGRFVYFMPLSAGARRSYSTAEDSFWCCVGSGMESHAKHADSIFWHDPATLYVNLFIPARLDLPERGLALDLDTDFPASGEVRLTLRRAPRTATAIALRLPGWSRAPVLQLNGRAAAFTSRDGYAVVARRWRTGDQITLTLPMALRAEPTPDDPALVAFVSGPLVLAADLGDAGSPYAAPAPALVGTGDAATLLRPDPAGPHRFTATLAQGGTASFRPFFDRYDRRTAVYVPVFTPERWRADGGAFLASERARIDLAERTVDTLVLGEQQPEIDHRVAAADVERVQLNGRAGRKLRRGQALDATLARGEGRAQLLRVVRWGEDLDQPLSVQVDGVAVRVPALSGTKQAAFVATDVPLPPGDGRDARLRVASPNGDAVLYELRTLAAPAA